MDEMLTYLLITSPLFVLCYGIKESYKAEYFTNVSLPCNYTNHNLSYPAVPVPIKRYWVLPNGTVLPDTFIGDQKFYIEKPDFNLYVAKIDDPDFGWYHCALLWNNWDYKIDVIRIGLNEDGPYYEKLLRQLERNLIIGSVSAGVFFILYMFGCWFWNHKTKKKRDREFTYIHSERQNNRYNYDAREDERPPSTEYGMYAKVHKKGQDNPNMNRSSYDVNVQTAKL